MDRFTNKYLLVFVLLFSAFPSFAGIIKKGDSFNAGSDINWDDMEFKFLGICICPRPPPVFYEEGEIYEYWDPSLFIEIKPREFVPQKIVFFQDNLYIFNFDHSCIKYTKCLLPVAYFFHQHATYRFCREIKRYKKVECQ